MSGPVSPSRALAAALALAAAHAAHAQSPLLFAVAGAAPSEHPTSAASGRPATLAASEPQSAPSERAVLRYKDPPPVVIPWQRTVGRWSTAVGFALLAGGATVALLNQRLSTDLERRYNENRLTTSDASKYDRVDAFNLVSTAMLAAGGAAAATGIVLWSAAPGTGPDPARPRAGIGIHGRF